MTNSLRPIALTLGEPAGVGPDIVLQLIQNAVYDIPIVILGDAKLLKERAQRLNLTYTLDTYETTTRKNFSVLEYPLPHLVSPGKPDTKNNVAVLASLDRAIQGCLQGEFSALVTGPLNKAVIHHTHADFRGHTEYLARAANVKKTVMLFTYQELRLALLTTHVPLSQVPHLITEDNLTTTIKILTADLQTRFGISQPKIIVTGLNPHAGEHGTIGREEITVIEPTLKKLQTNGYDILGPVSADTVFHLAKKFPHATILSLYHDQSLPVLKTLGFGELVNVTLGLPFIRTSVDHGTAFDVAGTHAADASGLQSAIQLAIQLVKKHASSTT